MIELIAQTQDITTYAPPVVTIGMVIGGIVYVCKLLYDLLNKIIKEKDAQIAYLNTENINYLKRLESMLEDKSKMTQLIGELTARVAALEEKIKELEGEKGLNRD